MMKRGAWTPREETGPRAMDGGRMEAASAVFGRTGAGGGPGPRRGKPSRPRGEHEASPRRGHGWPQKDCGRTMRPTAPRVNRGARRGGGRARVAFGPTSGRPTRGPFGRARSEVDTTASEGRGTSAARLLLVTVEALLCVVIPCFLGVLSDSLTV